MRINLEYNWGVGPIILLGILNIILFYLLRDSILPFLSPLLYFLDQHNSFLTIIGWFAVASLGIWAGKIHLRNSARLEIYKEIFKLKKNIDEKTINLGLTLSSFELPFKDMEYSESNNESLRRIVKNKNAGQIWIEHFNIISQQTSEFTNAYLQFWNHLNIWRAELSSLSLATDVLFTELTDISKKIHEHNQDLLRYQNENHKWREWDKVKIKQKADDIRTSFDETMAYLSDFMDLIHEELIRPIFGKKRTPRIDFNYRQTITSKTLTREGIEYIKYPPTRIATLKSKEGSQTKNN